MENIEKQLEIAATKLSELSKIVYDLRLEICQKAKKYQCKYCKYQSNYKSNVNKHQRICKQHNHLENSSDDGSSSCHLEVELDIQPPRIDERDEKIDIDHALLSDNIEDLVTRFLSKLKLDLSKDHAPRPSIRSVHKVLFRTILEDFCFHMNNNGDTIYYHSKKCDFSYFEHIHRLATEVLAQAVDLVNKKQASFKTTDFQRARMWTVWDEWLPVPKHRKDLTPGQKLAETNFKVEMKSLHCYLKNHKLWYEQQQKFQALKDLCLAQNKNSRIISQNI